MEALVYVDVDADIATSTQTAPATPAFDHDQAAIHALTYASVTVYAHVGVDAYVITDPYGITSMDAYVGIGTERARHEI